MTLTLKEAANIVRPLTQEQQQKLRQVILDITNVEKFKQIAAEMEKGKTLIIQDPEHPGCQQCGARLNHKGVCTHGCGRVAHEPRAGMI